jgi:hypothetical protein
VPAGTLTPTYTVLLTFPPAPLHERVKVLVELVRAPVDTDPDVPLVPLHAPEAVQLVALVELHVSVAEEPLVTVERFEERVSVGDGATGTGCPTGTAETVTP